MKTLCRIAGLLVTLALIARDGVAADRDAVAPHRTFTSGRYRVEVDLRPQVLRIEIPTNSLGLRADMMRLAPSPIATGQTEFLSAALLAHKAKEFDDGLMAAVELAAEQGQGRFPGKAALLRTVCAALSHADGTPEAREVMFAAAQLGGLAVTPPADLRDGLTARLATFEREDYASKPVGFYTWSPELRAIYRQDRMLQSSLRDRAGTRALAAALRGDSARVAYHAMLALAERLTNPLAWGDLRPLLRGVAPRETVSFFPPSATHEAILVQRLFHGLPPPPDFDLADEIVTEVRDGRLSLAPQSGSGWYDRQVWSFEPLLAPERTVEGKKLQIDDEYRELLVQLFKGLLALTRETQIKQTAVPVYVSIRPGDVRSLFEEPPITVLPELTVEPLATHYLRRAQAYAYVREVLEQAFGPEALSRMRRITAAGPLETPLGEELDALRALFVGAHALSCRQLGMPPDSGAQAEAPAAMERLAAWRKALSSDPDLSTDTRMMVPIFVDAPRGRTKVWVLLGWATRSTGVKFDTPPAVTVRTAADGQVAASHPPVEFTSLRVTIQFPVTAELYVKRVLDRDEFRKLCDTYKWRSDILEALQ